MNKLALKKLTLEGTKYALYELSKNLDTDADDFPPADGLMLAEIISQEDFKPLVLITPDYINGDVKDVDLEGSPYTFLTRLLDQKYDAITFQQYVEEYLNTLDFAEKAVGEKVLTSGGFLEGIMEDDDEEFKKC